MKRSRQARGFTLIELIISMAIVLLAMGLAGAGFVAQNQALQSSELHRVANAGNRDAMLVVEQTLRAVGWGVDPRYAIDVYTGAGSQAVDNDSTDTNVVDNTDVLTVFSRNPLYQWIDTNGGTCTSVGGCFTGNAWPITAHNTGARQFTITMQPNQVIEAGRRVQVQCIGGTHPVILTVSARVANGASVGPMTVTYGSTSTFPYNNFNSFTANANLYQACHGQVGASMFLLDRSRFYLRQPASAAEDPWLMLDTGADLNNDTAINATDHIPVARNIEDFQVAYLLRTFGGPGPDLPAGSGDYILGNLPGTPELPAAAASEAAPPLYTTPVADASRRTTATANVKGIRLAVVSRSVRVDPNRAGQANFLGDIIPRGENASGVNLNTTNDKRLRFPMVTEITLRNMESQRPFTF